MKFNTTPDFSKRAKADLLAIPFWTGKNGPTYAASGKVPKHAMHAIDAHDFKGNQDECLALYQADEKEPRIVLVGLGKKEEASTENLRRSYATLGQMCVSKKWSTLNIVLPSEEKSFHPIRGIAEGLCLVNYKFDRYKKMDDLQLMSQATLIGASKEQIDAANEAAIILSGTHFARDLANGNADDITPQTLAETALALEKEHKKIKTTVFDRKKIEKEKMGLFLAVNRGSFRDPAFIIVHYKGNPKSKDHTILIGKGVTFDTGGLNLKPTGSMEDMKGDMSGAAMALGTIKTAAALDLKVNLTSIVAATENSIGSKSYKPGDVYTAYNGTTVEIGNTDAEGRLTLADALAYAEKNLAPTRMFDFATLTGSCVVALGEENSALFSNNEDLANSIYQAGLATYERVWRMPLHDEYKKQLKSDIADLNNIGGRPAGVVTAAIFLKQFVEKTPWAHIDIAGTAFLDKARRYHPKHGTGIGVRLMIEFLKGL